MKKEDPPKLTVLYYEEFLQGEDMNEHTNANFSSGITLHDF